MTSRIIDLGFVGDIARCPKCGSRVVGEFSKYIAGSPGLNEYRSDCPGCGIKLRFRGNNWFVGYPDFEWVSPNGKWAIIGVFDGPVLEFDDAVAHVELAWPEGDNAVPIIILLDGSIVWGYDEDYRRSDYPENVARECERRLRRRYAELVDVPTKGTASRSVRSKPKSKSGKGKTNQAGTRCEPSRDPYDRYHELVRSRGYLSVPGGVIKLPDGTELYAESEMTLFEDQSPDEISFWTNCEDADGGSWGVAFTFPLDYFEHTPNGKLDWQGHVVDWTYDGPASASVRSKPKSKAASPSRRKPARTPR